MLYRRKHKKNIEHETSKRRVRKVARAGRAIANLTQEDLMKKRNEKPDFRKVQREQAIKAAKEKVRAMLLISLHHRAYVTRVCAPVSRRALLSPRLFFLLVLRSFTYLS